MPGYGFPEASLRVGMERQPDAIGVDDGSVGPGLHYLSIGKSFCSSVAIRRDLRLMLHAAKATLPRLMLAGDFGDTDVYGCQRHAPLRNVDLPV